MTRLQLHLFRVIYPSLDVAEEEGEGGGGGGETERRDFNLSSRRLAGNGKFRSTNIQRTRISSSYTLYAPPADDLPRCLHFV